VSFFFWHFLAVPLGGLLIGAVGMIYLSRKEPITPLTDYAAFALLVCLGTAALWVKVVSRLPSV
jgi:hypothetical protein